MKWNDLLFGMIPSFRYDNDYLSDMILYDHHSVPFLSGASKIETAPETGSEVPCGKAFRDYKKRKLEKRQVKLLKLPMGELCLAAL